ncbi:hypothetical protein ACOMHN_001239 [Nucella lapillus]
MAFFTAAFLLLTVLDPVAVFGQGSHGGSQGHGGGHSWDYYRHGYATNFRSSVPSCNGYKQSPINIEPACTVAYGALGSFSLAGYDSHGQYWHLKNNGHTAEMSNMGSQVILRGGSLNGNYVLDQFHFHWGSRNGVGSEHLIDGKASPLEMHMVHHNAYDSSQLAVLSFLFEMHSSDNPNFSAMLRYFNAIVTPGQEVVVPYFSVSNLIPRDFSGWGYFRYNGSLTTPPCSETVVWTVFEHKIGISYSQLEQFRQLNTEAGSKISDNFRMTQGINHRWVLHRLPYYDQGNNYNQYADCARSQYGGAQGGAGSHGGSSGGHAGNSGGHGHATTPAGHSGGHGHATTPAGHSGGHGHATTPAGHSGGHGGGHSGGHSGGHAATTAGGGD